MERTYYKLTLGMQKLGEGEVDVDPRLFVNTKFLDALIELAEKTGYAIRWNRRWRHPIDSNYSPLDWELELIPALIEYGPISSSTPYSEPVELQKI